MMLTTRSRWLWTLGVAALLFTQRAGAQNQAANAAKVASPSDVLLGEWWTENNEGRIRFTRDRDGTFRGTSTCCVPTKIDEEHPGKDIHNPNPQLRDRSTVGIVIIWKLTFEDGEFTGGRVYNPRDGKTYHMQVTVIDHDSIKVRGYIGIPLLGQSQVWKRVRQTAPDTRATSAR